MAVRSPNAKAQPRSDREEAVVKSNLQKTYPQMFTKEWMKRFKKGVKSELKKGSTSTIKRIQQSRKEKKSALEGALSKDEIKRLGDR